MADSTFQSLARPLFLTTRKAPISPPDIDCHYCQLKQKFSGPGVKCVEHTITDNRSSPSQSDQHTSNQSTADIIVGLLGDAEEALEEYWNNLYEHSHGSTQKARAELNSIAAALRRFQDAFSKFPPTDAPPSPPCQTRVPQEERKLATRSEKFLTSNFSQLSEEAGPGEQIKEWVLYFQRILVSRQLREEQLPLDDEIDMRIFKESMERRFLSFAKGYQRYEQRTGQALQRLLFYMEQFGGQISQDQFKRDLQFLEESDERPPSQAREELHRLILMQAVTIQHLLAQKELEVEGELMSSSRSRMDTSRTMAGYDLE